MFNKKFCVSWAEGHHDHFISHYSMTKPYSNKLPGNIKLHVFLTATTE